MLAITLTCLPAYSQKSDSSRIAFFYRAGRDITVPEHTEKGSLPYVEDAVKKGFRQSDFVQLHVGLVYQMRNRWGLGFVYSNFPTPEIPVHIETHFESLYPGYSVVNPTGAGKLNLGSDFLSLHVERSFQKKFFFVCPYAEAGMGYGKQPIMRAFMKQSDANRYLAVAVSYRAPLSYSYTCGMEVGVRFFKNLFSISLSPSIGSYNWHWTQTDSSVDFFGQKTSVEKRLSICQTHFLFMANIGIRLPLSLQFYETL